MSNGSRRSGTCVRCCLVAFAVASALYVSGPALYWRFNRGLGEGNSYPFPSSCAPCACDCPSVISLQKIAPGLANLSIPDCGKDDPEMSKEMEKQFVDLLTEELKLQEAVAAEHDHHTNYTVIEARRLASQYQKEAEKCNAATETCEEAREGAEAALRREKKATATWEFRARQLGWQGDSF